MKVLTKFLVVFMATFLSWSCSNTVEEIVPVEIEIDSEVAIKWADLTLDVIKNSPYNSPTYASRSLAYMGLSMYESTVQGSIVYQSISSSLNGLGAMPIASDTLEIDWELSLNAAQATMLRSLYPHTPTAYSMKIDSLNQAIVEAKRVKMVSDKTLKNSAEFGISIANKIIQWSTSDGGHKGYENTFDSEYKLKTGMQYWYPPRVGQAAVPLPMHPHWGENRNFLMSNSQLEIPEILPYSHEKSSAYYKEMEIVYLVQKNLDQKSKENALWWGDDPFVSVSPPGHSYYLAKKLLQENNEIKLFEATSTFAKVGISVAESFINCWKCKFHFSAERPTPYIKRVIDGSFNQFWPEPPFPAFTSGHSTQAAAAAIAMISVFGDDTPFVDDLHEGRHRDEFRNVDFKSRSYNTIWEMAEDCGYSRIEGGIHTPQDNKVGLSEGKKIGQNVVDLPWKVTEITQ